MLLPWVLSIATLVILGTELAMWLLFEQRIKGLHLHLGQDRFFTFARIRLLIVLHAVALLAITDLSLLLLW